jgi:hypothetical protein
VILQVSCAVLNFRPRPTLVVEEVDRQKETRKIEALPDPSLEGR